MDARLHGPEGEPGDRRDHLVVVPLEIAEDNRHAVFRSKGEDRLLDLPLEFLGLQHALRRVGPVGDLKRRSVRPRRSVEREQFPSYCATSAPNSRRRSSPSARARGTRSSPARGGNADPFISLRQRRARPARQPGGVRVDGAVPRRFRPAPRGRGFLSFAELAPQPRERPLLQP
jgi:hypothetical protein